MSIGNLVVSLGLDAADFTSGLTRAERDARKFSDEAKKMDAVLLASAKSAAVVAGAIGSAIGAVATFTIANAKAVDEFNDLADATGASIENISALDLVARQTGGSFDTAASSLVKFNKILGDTKTPGSEASAVVKALGLSADELRQLDPAEALRQTAVALSGYADNGEKARAIQVLFGKSVQEAAPFLKDLAEQTKLVGVTSTKAAEDAEKFNKEIYRFEAAATNMARAVSTILVSAINETIAKFREGAAEGKSFYRVIAEAQLKTLGLNPEQSNASKLANIQTTTKLLEDQNLTVERRERLERKLLALQNSVIRLDSTAGAGRGSVHPPFVKPALSIDDGKGGKSNTAAVSRAMTDLAAQEIASQRERIALLGKEGELERINAEIALGKFGKITSAQKLQLQYGAILIDQHNDDARAFKESEAARDAAAAAMARSVQASLDQLDSLATGNQQMREEIELMGASAQAHVAIENARIESLITTKAMTIAEGELTGIGKERNAILEAEILLLRERQNLNVVGVKKEEEIDELKKRELERKRLDDLVRDNLANTFTDFITGSITAADAFKNFANSIIHEMVRIQAQRFAKEILSGVGGGSGLFDFINGIGSALFGTKMATGTNYVPYDGFKASLHKGEAVVPAKYNPAAGGQSGSGMVIHQNYTINARGADAGVDQRIRQAMQQTKAETIAAVQDKANRGGGYARSLGRR